MAPLLGIDVAWDRPTVAQIKALGAHWVARYFSTDGSKDLTAAEVTAYPAAGLAIVTVWETTTGRATGGFAAGVVDAHTAEEERAAAGLPPTHVHHFAVDEDTSWASVQPYFNGIISVLGLARTGCYGGLHVIEGAHAHGIRYLWQTVAWSNGQWSPYATIRQTGGTVLSGGADLDDAEVPDFGQTPRPVAPKPPTPTPPVPPVRKENLMLIATVDRTTVPKGSSWPGDFAVLGNGVLIHIKNPTEEARLKAQGAFGPMTVDWAEYQRLLTK